MDCRLARTVRVHRPRGSRRHRRLERSAARRQEHPGEIEGRRIEQSQQTHRGAQRGLSSLIANAAERRICLLYRDYTAGSVGKGEALAKFDEIWELYLETPCGDPTLGTSGKCCIEERCRGGDFDWFAKYRDPIAGGKRDEPEINERCAHVLGETFNDDLKNRYPNWTPNRLGSRCRAERQEGSEKEHAYECCR